ASTEIGSELAHQQTLIEIKVIQLKYARASELVKIIESVITQVPLASVTNQTSQVESAYRFILRQENGEQFIASAAVRRNVLILPDHRTNSLIVSAPVEYLRLLELLIQYLDQTTPQSAKIKIFNLKNADARQMATVLSSVFRLEARDSKETERSIRYTLVMPYTEQSGEVSAIIGSAEEHALTVTVDLRTNSLIVGGTDQYVELASKIIETLDAAPAQERKTYVYRLKNAKASDVEQALRTFLQQDIQKVVSVLGQNGIGTVQNILDREVSIVAEQVSNCLLISASPRYFNEVIRLIEELDQPQPQVLIQVLLAEVTLDQNNTLGIEWSYMTKGDPQVRVGLDYGIAEAMRITGGGFTAITGNNVDILIHMLQNQGRLEVLSRPQILAADNQKATINIGQRVPLITDSRVTERGDTINQFKYENIGVILEVTPRITPDNFVTLDVSPTVSELSSSTVDVSPGVSIPIINQRSASTTVTVQSGQSVLIGGLISTVDDIRVKKIPLLGDIPGLGYLFSTRTAKKERKELLIVLTPHILVKGKEIGKVEEASEWTRRQLESSSFQQQLRRDEFQQRVFNELSGKE
ncbi:MAG: secretin N-terminal domain-containing protein, partial [candidate division WOR-3 bacterium]